LNSDVLKSIEENANAAFAHKNFLSKLHNPMTDEATLSNVIQLESIIEQFARSMQKKEYIIGRISHQNLAQAAVFEKANHSVEKVAQMKAEKIEPGCGIQECIANIEQWEQEKIQHPLLMLSLPTLLSLTCKTKKEMKEQLKE
jgi:hypothetical protein